MIPEKFTYPFRYTPLPEIVEASQALIGRIDADPGLRSIFAEGKMMGVLMVQAPDGEVSYLYGFSGVAGGRSLVDGFVPPIHDLTDPHGPFKTKEVEISALNSLIKEISDTAKDPPGSDTMLEDRLKELKARRKEMSTKLQEWIFGQYVVMNARGESRSILEIFADRGLVPPGGTGDCAAPKMLQYAYLHGLKPLAMGEFWYGASPSGEIRRQGCFYPSCTGKCGPLLAYMLQGLDVESNPLEDDDSGLEVRILHEDDDIIVVEKPSGMLAVPGRTLKVSLQERLQRQAGDGVLICSCHRLDMDTSGLMVFAKGVDNQAVLQQQFERREVRKTYLALLSAQEGTATAAESAAPPADGAQGRITLPLMLDYYDRPRQMVDFEHGKQAVTDYEVLRRLPDGRTLVRFTPLTGRTHQLRVHSAHPLGLGRPIEGDRLYGGGSHGRLCLHAATIEFSHPRTGEWLKFSSVPDFI